MRIILTLNDRFLCHKLRIVIYDNNNKINDTDNTNNNNNNTDIDTKQQVLGPQVEKMCIDRGLTDESEILRFLQVVQSSLS